MKLVLGATGNVGNAVVRELAGRQVPVRAVVRAGKVVNGGPNVTDVVGDLDDAATIVPHLSGVDAMFMLSGYGSTAGLLDGAAAAGVGHVAVLSSFSAGSAASEENAVAKYHRETEAAVRASGIPYTFVRPMSFMSNALRWHDEIAGGGTVVEPFPDAASATIDPADIAAVAAVAMTSRGHDGEVLTVTGPEALLPADRLAILGEALGRELRLVGVEPDAVRDHLLAQMPAYYADAFIELLGDGVADESTVTTTVADVLGRPPATFTGWAGRNAVRFSC